MKKQHKLLLLFFILIGLFKSYSQNYEVNLSPEGKLETIYDNQVKKIIRLNTNGTHDTSFSIGSGTTDSVEFLTAHFVEIKFGY